MAIDIRRNIYRPIQDMIFGATTHLVLPQHNDATTPTLAFGDGNTGFYESADNILALSLAGAGHYTFKTIGIAASNYANGFLLRTGNASNIDPTFAPNQTDTDTGIGHAAADQLSLIAGAEEGLRISEADGVANMNIICHGNEVICHENEVVICGSA